VLTYTFHLAMCASCCDMRPACKACTASTLRQHVLVLHPHFDNTYWLSGIVNSSERAESGRSLLANSNQEGADTPVCFGDGSAGCCGSMQCALHTDSATGQVKVSKEVGMQEGETYTNFTFHLGNPKLLTGSHLDQVAMLFTVDTMAEMSVSHVEQRHPQDTHIGCNPLDGYIAWRQTLPCASCGSAPSDSYKFGISIKVCLLMAEYA
jgi:hypothetical protein